LIGDCLTGFKRIDLFSRCASILFATVGFACAACYWRQIYREGSQRRHEREVHGRSEGTITHRNPPAKLLLAVNNKDKRLIPYPFYKAMARLGIRNQSCVSVVHLRGVSNLRPKVFNRPGQPFRERSRDCQAPASFAKRLDCGTGEVEQQSHQGTNLSGLVASFLGC